MKLTRVVLSALATVLLSACAAQDGAKLEAAPPPAEPICGAEKVGAYVGTPMSDEVLAKINSASSARSVRVVGPDDAMTMDFRQDRLTITTDEQGRIKTLRCG